MSAETQSQSLMDPSRLPTLRTGFSLCSNNKDVETFTLLAKGLMVLFVEEGCKTAAKVAFAQGKVFIDEKTLSDSLKYQAHNFFDSCEWDENTVFERAQSFQSFICSSSESSESESENERFDDDDDDADDHENRNYFAMNTNFDMAECLKLQSSVVELAEKWSSYDPGDDVVLQLVKNAIDKADATLK